MPIGLLVNFKNSKVEIKRMVWNLPENNDNYYLVTSTRYLSVCLCGS